MGGRRTSAHDIRALFNWEITAPEGALDEVEKALKAAVGNDSVWAGMHLFLVSLNTESDRGAVLVSSSYLEDRLGELIRRFLVAGSDTKALLDDFNGPFGTFSARIKGAHGLGIINDAERNRLETLRKIRNEFAHSLQASFDQQHIRSLIQSMKLLDKMGQEIRMPLRHHFSLAAAQIVVSLSNRIGIVDQHQLKPVAWPPWS